MKNKSLIAVLLITFVLLCGSYLETFQQQWSALRTGVAVSDATPLDGTTASRTYAFASKPSTAIKLNERWNGAEMYFYGTDAANEAGTFKVWAWKSDGPARLIYAGTVTLGTAVTGATNTFYVDTIAETTNNNSCTIIDSAENRVCILGLGDLRGYQWINCEITLTTAASLSCEITSY